MYCDSDSFIFIQKDNDPQKFQTGDYLGDLTYELEEFGCRSFVEEFVSGDPKNYAFSVFCPSTGKSSTKCKAKFITLNYENSKIVTFTNMRNMTLGNAPPMHVYNPPKIKPKHGGVVVSEPETKDRKIFFKKRRLRDNFDSLTFGY